MIHDPAGHAFTETATSAVRDLLAHRWDPDGALRGAAANRHSDDVLAPRSLEDFTRTVCGILAAGGTLAEVVSFLRGEEAQLLGATRTPPRELNAIGRAAWLAVRGRPGEAGAEDD
ncbi:MAG TPA: hypothetical protein VFT96_00530 [Gemmatimonadaceae bacterium]|nr:hypothetical protein [Gemmatimonadaceae bacterium]